MSTKNKLIDLDDLNIVKQGIEKIVKDNIGSALVPTTRKVNNKALSADITLTASDVGALPSTTKIPSKTSDLTNDSGFITSYTNTTYSLTQDSTDGHKITLTPSNGTAQTITIPDNDTKYSAGTGLSLSGTTFSNSAPCYYTKGTQTAATNAWTGALPAGVTNYYDGLTIDYFLPFAGTSSAATLNLGSKGAKPIYLGNSTSGVTTHFPQYSIIHMVYCVNSALNSGNGCWKVSAYYNANTVPQAQCETSAATAAKVATCTNYSLAANSYTMVNLKYANTSKTALTLNINSKGAKPIYINDVASSTTNYTLPAGSYIVFYDGTNFYFRSDGKITNLATESKDGLMSSTDKTKLNGIATGATANTGTVTSVAVKMNNTTKGTITSSGTIDLGTVLTSGSQTTTSSADGGSNIYTFSDGSTITVKNGTKGSKGDTGATGATGHSPSVTATKSGTVTSIKVDGTEIAKINDGTNGSNGTNGKDGAAATISVGTVTTGAAGTSASVTNAGTSSAAKFNFTIPKGDKGDKGDPGQNATTTAVATTSANGLCPKLGGGTTNYLRADGSWANPASGQVSKFWYKSYLGTQTTVTSKTQFYNIAATEYLNELGAYLIIEEFWGETSGLTLVDSFTPAQDGDFTFKEIGQKSGSGIGSNPYQKTYLFIVHSLSGHEETETAGLRLRIKETTTTGVWINGRIEVIKLNNYFN